MALRARVRLVSRHVSALLAGCQRAVCAENVLHVYRQGGQVPVLTESPRGFACAHRLHCSAHQQAGLEVKVDSFGESITEGTVAEVLKQRGDSVAEDAVILQIDTDKVTIDVRAPTAGVIDSILVRSRGAALALELANALLCKG